MVALPNAPRTPTEPSPPSAPGFTIRLPSAQLADLIQINCVNRIRGAFRVNSDLGEGQLFFQGGLLVHALCGDQVGLDAVVQMLGWRGGSIEPCALPWPAESTIDMGADALLLCAAQRLDERSRRESARPAARADVTTKVVRRVPWPDTSSAPAAAAPARAPEESSVSLKAAVCVESLARLEVARVTLDGHLQASRPGSASTDLADTAFFCQRLATLIGDGLGLGACRALACENAAEGVVVFEGRSIVGLRGHKKDLALVLAKVGLR